MSTPILSFDIDGVLADFTSDFTKLLNKHGETDHPKDWPTYNCYGEGQLFTRKAWDLAWDEQKTIPGFWYGLEPLPNVHFNDINRMMLRGEFNGYFVTRRSSTCPVDITVQVPGGTEVINAGDVTMQTRHWLRKQGIREYSGVIAGDFNRAELLRQLKADAHVDDWGDQYEKLIDEGINCYLIDRTNNRHLRIGDRRVYSIREYITKALADHKYKHDKTLTAV